VAVAAAAARPQARLSAHRGRPLDPGLELFTVRRGTGAGEGRWRPPTATATPAAAGRLTRLLPGPRGSRGGNERLAVRTQCGGSLPGGTSPAPAAPAAQLASTLRGT